jgi:hypothetical protein
MEKGYEHRKPASVLKDGNPSSSMTIWDATHITYLPHSSTDAVISSSRLDKWFTALHPNNYINEPDRTCMGQMPPVRIEYYHEIYGMVCQSQQ